MAEKRPRELWFPTVKVAVTGTGRRRRPSRDRRQWRTDPLSNALGDTCRQQPPNFARVDGVSHCAAAAAALISSSTVREDASEQKVAAADTRRVGPDREAAASTAQVGNEEVALRVSLAGNLHIVPSTRVLDRSGRVICHGTTAATTAAAAAAEATDAHHSDERHAVALDVAKFVVADCHLAGARVGEYCRVGTLFCGFVCVCACVVNSVLEDDVRFDVVSRQMALH